MICYFGDVAQFVDPGKVGFPYRDKLYRYR